MDLSSSLPSTSLKSSGARARFPSAPPSTASRFRQLADAAQGVHILGIGKDILAAAAASPRRNRAGRTGPRSTPRAPSPSPPISMPLSSRAPAQAKTFAALSYSHKKEFVDWIESAKKPRNPHQPHRKSHRHDRHAQNSQRLTDPHSARGWRTGCACYEKMVPVIARWKYLCISLILLMAATASAPAHALLSSKEKEAQQAGAVLFRDKGCAYCHGAGGSGGKKAPRSGLHTDELWPPDKITNQILNGGQRSRPSPIRSPMSRSRNW